MFCSAWKGWIMDKTNFVVILKVFDGDDYLKTIEEFKKDSFVNDVCENILVKPIRNSRSASHEVMYIFVIGEVTDKKNMYTTTEDFFENVTKSNQYLHERLIGVFGERDNEDIFRYQ